MNKQNKSYCRVPFDSVTVSPTGRMQLCCEALWTGGSEKTKIKGSVAHPFYKWAATELGLIAKPRWNFHIYLISPNGQLTNWFSSPTSPTATRVIKAVEAILPH